MDKLTSGNPNVFRLRFWHRTPEGRSEVDLMLMRNIVVTVRDHLRRKAKYDWELDAQYSNAILLSMSHENKESCHHSVEVTMENVNDQKHYRFAKHCAFGLVNWGEEASVTFEPYGEDPSADYDIDFEVVSSAVTSDVGLVAQLQDLLESVPNPDYIGEDNYVYHWDRQAGGYVKTDIYVKGDKGDEGETSLVHWVFNKEGELGSQTWNTNGHKWSEFAEVLTDAKKDLIISVKDQDGSVMYVHIVFGYFHPLVDRFFYRTGIVLEEGEDDTITVREHEIEPSVVDLLTLNGSVERGAELWGDTIIDEVRQNVAKVDVKGNGVAIHTFLGRKATYNDDEIATVGQLPEANPQIPQGTTPSSVECIKIGGVYYRIPSSGGDSTLVHWTFKQEGEYDNPTWDTRGHQYSELQAVVEAGKTLLVTILDLDGMDGIYSLLYFMDYYYLLPLQDFYARVGWQLTEGAGGGIDVTRITISHSITESMVMSTEPGERNVDIFGDDTIDGTVTNVATVSVGSNGVDIQTFHGRKATYNGEELATKMDLESIEAGADGVGIADVTFKQTDANGNNIYTITLTDGTTRDFAAPKGAPGAAGANGANGQDGRDGRNGADGANGADGVGIASIVFKQTDAYGNNIYTITLTNGTTQDIVAPKGAAGANGTNGVNGQDGADGADGVGIASIVFKQTDANGGNVYTITLSNGNTQDIVAPKGAAGTNGTNGTNGVDGRDGRDGTDGGDGADGVGIASIVFKQTDANGGNVYTITLTNGNTQDIVAPKGAAGTNGTNGTNGVDGRDGRDGTDGADGADGVGIASVVFKETNAAGGNVYTITLSNGSTYDFVAPKGVDGTNGTNGTNGVDGRDGVDGVGITLINYKSTDPNGNHVYTVTLSNGNTYDITTPRGTSGADGVDGVGIDHIEFKRTDANGGNVYTMTLTNNQQFDFTAPKGGDGLYLGNVPGQGVNIQKVYEDEQKTVQINPQTHVKAVVDDNGTSVDDLIAQVIGIVNQAQLELGAVQTDLYPTENSTNYLTSGAVWAALHGKFVKKTDAEIEDMLENETWIPDIIYYTEES